MSAPSALHYRGSWHESARFSPRTDAYTVNSMYHISAEYFYNVTKGHFAKNEIKDFLHSTTTIRALNHLTGRIRYITLPLYVEWDEDNGLLKINPLINWEMDQVWGFIEKNNVPYIIQAHGSVLPFFQKTRLKRLFDKLWGNNILKDSSKVIAGTEAEFDQYIQMGVKKEQIEIIPNAINFQIYKKLPLRGSFRKKFGLNETDKIILYLGGVVNDNGY